MIHNQTREVQHEYHINLSVDEALEVRDSLAALVWQVAKEEGVEDTLRRVDLRIAVGEPAIDPGILITVVVTYLASKTLDVLTEKAIEKVMDEAEEAWQRILPKIRRHLKDERGRDDVFVDGE